MYQIIAPTLFQNKICRLPGIGTLLMVLHPAETDFVNSRLRSPVETIDFIAGDEHDKEFNEFSAISELLQKNLDENGAFLLKGIGTFKKLETGEVKFVPLPLDPVFNFSVPAEMVSRQAATHSMLVGDQQTTNVEMTEYFSEKPVVNDRWWIWAAALAAVGTGVIIFYLYQHGFNAIGNVSR